MYLAGVVFYVTRFPECTKPGCFDMCSSHALWHVFIVCAAYTHFIGVWNYMQWRNVTPCNN